MLRVPVAVLVHKGAAIQLQDCACIGLKVCYKHRRQHRAEQLSQASYEHCLRLLETLPKKSKVKQRLQQWLHRHSAIQQTLTDLPLVDRSDIIESLFGNDFVAARKAHSTVESGINALEVRGLDKCLDQGIDGFKRYVALVVLSRNIQKSARLCIWSFRSGTN